MRLIGVAFRAMRIALVVCVLSLVACGDDGPSEEERVAAVCDAWQDALDADPEGQEETLAGMQQVAVVALESESHMALLGQSLSESLDPFDRAAFQEAAAGFEEECSA